MLDPFFFLSDIITTPPLRDYLNLVSIIFAVLSFFYVCQVYKITKSRGILLINLGIFYAMVVRIFNFFYFLRVPSTQLMIVFWVLSSFGFMFLWISLKKYTKG